MIVSYFPNQIGCANVVALVGFGAGTKPAVVTTKLLLVAGASGDDAARS